MWPARRSASVEAQPKRLEEEPTMSVKSAANSAAVVASVFTAVVLGAAPTAAHANAVMHVDAVSPLYVSVSPPTGRVIDCTADAAARFVRPCMIRKGSL
jgi:hypothetical protein